MANNYTLYDSGGIELTFKSTDTAGVHVAHHNTDQVSGQTLNFGSGAAGAGTLRVILASDSPGIGSGGGDATAANQATMIASLSVLDDWDESGRAKVNLIVGQAGVAGGAGAAGATVIRTVTASDSPDAAALGAIADAAVTNPASSGSVVALLKGLLSVIGTILVGLVDGLEGYLDGVEGKLDTLARQPTSYHHLVISLASVNATNVKASAATLFFVSGYNANAAVRYLHLYNKASSPTVGTDVPVLTIALPPSAAFFFPFPAAAFSTGLGYGFTTDGEDTDSGALASGDILGFNVGYA